MEFWSHEQIPEKLHTLKHFGRMLYFIDSDWTVIYRNHQRARRKRRRLSYMLVWEGNDTRNSGRLYMAVVRYVLLFGSKSQVIIPRILWTLGILHIR